MARKLKPWYRLKRGGVPPDTCVAPKCKRENQSYPGFCHDHLIEWWESRTWKIAKFGNS